MGPVISEPQKSTGKTHRLLSQIFCSLLSTRTNDDSNH